MIETLKKERIAECNIVCAILMLALLVSQFMPFWQYADKDETVTVSIQEYVWMAYEHDDLPDSFKDALGEKVNLNQIVLMPIVCLVACAVGVVMCLRSIDGPVTAIASLIAGGFGVWGYLTVPAYKLGAGIAFPVVVSALALLGGVISIALALKRNAEL